MLFFRYWGKTVEDGRYHLLPYHCLDVAAVAAAWWEASPTIRRSFSTDVTNTEAQNRAWVLFFVALHDYGKADLRFQLKVRDRWRNLQPLAESGLALPSLYEIKGYRHGESGLYWFKRDFFARCGCDMDNDALFRDKS